MQQRPIMCSYFFLKLNSLRPNECAINFLLIFKSRVSFFWKCISNLLKSQQKLFFIDNLWVISRFNIFCWSIRVNWFYENDSKISNCIQITEKCQILPLGSYTNHVATKGERGVPQKTTTLHNSYLVKVATWGGRGSKFWKKWIRGLCMAPYETFDIKKIMKLCNTAGVM